MKVHKRQVPLDAHQWWRNGDHPQDESKLINRWGPRWGRGHKIPEVTMGRVVGYCSASTAKQDDPCGKCGRNFVSHGRLNLRSPNVRRENGPIVCPGDWIITHPATDKDPITFTHCAKTDFYTLFMRDPVPWALDNEEGR